MAIGCCVGQIFGPVNLFLELLTEGISLGFFREFTREIVGLTYGLSLGVTERTGILSFGGSVYGSKDGLSLAKYGVTWNGKILGGEIINSPQREEANSWLIRGTLLMKEIVCFKKVFILMYFIAYFFKGYIGGYFGGIYKGRKTPCPNLEVK